MLASLRQSGIFAVLSGIIWLLLSPLMVTVGICNGVCLTWYDKPLIIRAFGPWLADQGWLSFAPGEVLYFTYGRFFFLVYLCISLGLAGLQRFQTSRAPSVGRFTRFSYWFLLCSLLIAAFGDFLSYGIGVISEAAWRNGFGLEMLAWPGIVVGSVLYGIAMLRLRRTPAWTALILMAGAILLPLMFFDQSLVRYWPNAQLLPYSFAWTILGVYQLMSWRQHSRASGASSRE